MNNKCKYLKIRTKKKFIYYYCSLQKKIISAEICRECQSKEYKKSEYKPMKKVSKTPIKQRTSKQAKLEKDRFSIFTNNTELCLICQQNKKDHMHEVFCGCRRQVSMKWGVCIPICKTCHSEFQNDASFNDYWHVRGQKAFMKYYNKSADEFRKIFGKNYLDNDK